ncbi:MAG: formylglycine-generating enzyme family protein [Saprospiraceae bacterium]
MQILSQSLPNLPQPFDMLPVPGGTFHMGDEHGDLWDACRPVHKVKVADFYIGKFPVTQALWRAVAQAQSVGVTSSHPGTPLDPSPSHFPGDDRPVEKVSWGDAQAFIQKLNDLTESTRPAGHRYRLPTEAEWEFAARGGILSLPIGEGWGGAAFKYAGSDRLKDVGWYDANSGNETKPVGLKYPNQLGIYDMSGNVWEWCEDWFDEKYYEQCKQQGTVENPRGPEKGSNRVRRGGGWFGGARYCRAADRNYWRPDYRHYYLGFRLALSLQ